MGFLKLCNKAIEYSFYALFLLVPLVFAGNTSELFEFNKMWIAFALTIIIGFFWFSKMFILKRIVFRRTVLDIPIALFLGSQIISTLISLDTHISIWGYYSRFNGGLLSFIAYIFLFYAFISNFANNSEEANSGQNVVRKSLIVSIFSGLLAVIWALPSHFGHDPTCLVFRGNFDISCWTADFVPTIRMFGPLGQPDWLAGYLGVLLPISGAFALDELRTNFKIQNPKFLFYAVSFFLFYVSLLFTASRSGIGSGVLTTVLFLFVYGYLNRTKLNLFKNKVVLGLAGIFLVLSFLIGVQLPIIDKISLGSLTAGLNKPAVSKQAPAASQTTPAPTSGEELGGSNSFEIRKIVWKGAVDAWKANPVFGTGVETFAFAYYKYRPVEHNLVSEWNFLYNKAHNEYLNYLATTGAVGLLTYLFFIGSALTIFVLNLKNLNPKSKYLSALKSDQALDISDPIPLSLLFSFISILIINFFGFSVVILNIYLFLIPAFFLLLAHLYKAGSTDKQKFYYISLPQWGLVAVVGVAGIFLLYLLGRYWLADTKYALGFNYNHAGEYQTAYPLLHDAVKLRSEPVFQDELSVNDAILATGFAAQGSTDSATLAQNLAKESITTSDQLTSAYPNNILFWKTRVRIFYSLASVDPRYYANALSAIQQAALLAPTDASVLYNLGVLYGQNGDSKKAVEVLERTIAYKPDYREAHFALGIFYHDLGVSKTGTITDPALLQKALGQMEYILKNLNSKDTQAQEYLSTWEKEK